MSGPQIGWLPDGRRLHMNHGPIDLIVEAFGEASEVRQAYSQAAERFRSILEELVTELPELRRPALAKPRAFAGPTARRMEAAASALCDGGTVFLTPMAAVAGAVADEVLAALVADRMLDRAYVNNGGDVALHLSEGAALTLAIGAKGNGMADRVTLDAADPVRGVATSGWRGRSFSLGIADAVTVLARDGASADAAATLIANAVDLPGHPAIERSRASDLQPDSDLAERMVTTGVGALMIDDVRAALARGVAVADDLVAQGLIAAAALFLGDEVRMTGTLLTWSPAVPPANTVVSAGRSRYGRADPQVVVAI